MTRDIGSGLFIGGLFVLFLCIAVFLPQGGLTGNAVQEDSCKDGQCLELCDSDTECTAEGHVCCSTNWETGVCGYETQCALIQEQSLYQSVEVYQDGVRERPAPVQATWRWFFAPLLVAALAIGYFILKRRDPLW